MFLSRSGGVAPRGAEAVLPNAGRQNGCELWQADVSELRQQYALAPRNSPERVHLFRAATTRGGKVAAFLEPLLPREVLGGIVLNAQEREALQSVVFLPANEVGLDLLMRAGLPDEAARDLCDMLRDGPDDIVMSTIVSAARTPVPLANWWLKSPGPIGDSSSRDARRELRVLQLVGYRQWPFDENIWRGVVVEAGEALRGGGGDSALVDARTGMALLDLLPRQSHAQRCIILCTGEPLLLYAMRRGFPAAGVEKMLSLGFDANVSSPAAQTSLIDPVPIIEGATPLHYAAHTGDIEAIGLLASHGACLDARDVHGNSPMMYANARAMVAVALSDGKWRGPSTERLAHRNDLMLRDAAAAVVRTLHNLGADPHVCGRDGEGVVRTLILSVLASREGGGMHLWPDFSQLLVTLHSQGVPFHTPNCPDARQVTEFALINAPDNPNDAVWALGALLAQLEAR
ncbi:ankyrin repeat domain-containing protein [Pandoraea sp. NPDC087047]|uniref:ankyrin repeat domain-containing protein n=1 Tax=Pandoraea sp. NPDC087047 TaxID=3364390 RepID=UPI00382D0C1F